MGILSGTSFRAQAVLFDMDGTLVDSTAAVERTWRGWAARHGLDPDAILQVAHGRRTIETVRMFAPPGLDLDRECLELDAATSGDTDGVVPIKGAPELLAALPAGRWAIVTSAGRAMAETRLRSVGLAVPEVLVAAEDVSSGKPDPEGYRQAARRLGFDPRDAVVFEDAPAGLEAGHAAGARVIALATTLRPAELDGQDWLHDLSALTVRLDGDGLEFTAAPR
ncbi:HAD family hydrolase [Arenibaculum pallidiluteum]|uniref:HAD family hydrolase n=1 Tax=Arenibaculum pallidiluteum TaxID=2812559 RepID=UPI001A979865|nr:HAD family hydrolase [Arenibaculum pallidiluteum]